MQWTTHISADEVWSRIKAGSAIDPVIGNWILSAVHRNRGRADDHFRYWLLREGDTIAGLALYSTGPARLDFSLIPAGLGRTLAEEVVEHVPSLAGVLGPAPAGAEFAGRWTEVANVGARPTDGGRVLQATEVKKPSNVNGLARLATSHDVDQMVEWNAGFATDTDVAPPPDPAVHMQAQVDTGTAWLWETQSEPVAMSLLTRPVCGTRRIAHVYTPSELRGNGFAGALVSDLTQRTLAAGDRCMLHTQLSNPASNRLYRSLGFRAVSESTFYEFTD